MMPGQAHRTQNDNAQNQETKRPGNNDLDFSTNVLPGLLSPNKKCLIINNAAFQYKLLLLKFLVS